MIKRLNESYVKKIYILILIVFILLTSITAISTFFFLERIIIQKEFEYSNKKVNTLKKNIEFQDDYFMNLCFSIFTDINIERVMYEKISDIEIQQIISNLYQIYVRNNPYVHSINIFSEADMQIYSTSSNFLHYEKSNAEIKKSYRSFPRLMPVLQTFLSGFNNDVIGKENVISYYMFDHQDPSESVDGYIVLNINPEGLLLEQENYIEENDQLTIVDSLQQSILKDFKQSNNEIEGIVDFVLSADEQSISSIKEINDVEYVVNSVWLNRVKWKIITHTPLEKVLQRIHKFRNTFFYLFSLVILITVISSLLISYKISKPINNLLEKINVFTNLQVFRSRIDIADSTQKINNLKNIEEHDSILNPDIFRNKYLNIILTKKIELEENEVKLLQLKKIIKINLYEPIQILVIQIDQFKELYSNLTGDEYELLLENIKMLLIKNIFMEYLIEVYQWDQEKIILLININETTILGNDEFKSIQKLINDNLIITVSVYFGEIAKNYMHIKSILGRIFECVPYRKIFGKNTILNPDDLSKNMESKICDLPDTEKRAFTQIIKSGKYNEINAKKDELFEFIKNMNFTYINVALVNFVNIFKKAVEELNIILIDPIIIDFDYFISKVTSSNSLNEISVEFSEIIKSITEQKNSNLDKKQIQIVESIKSIIHTRFSDKGLCQKKIASELNLSTKYVSSSFHSSMGLSIAEYLNEIRLEQAVKWLENSNLNIGEILNKIGMENESYFYRLFKQKFGITPKNYSLNKKIKM